MPRNVPGWDVLLGLGDSGKMLQIKQDRCVNSTSKMCVPWCTATFCCISNKSGTRTGNLTNIAAVVFWKDQPSTIMLKKFGNYFNKYPPIQMNQTTRCSNFSSLLLVV